MILFTPCGGLGTLCMRVYVCVFLCICVFQCVGESLVVQVFYFCCCWLHKIGMWIAINLHIFITCELVSFQILIFVVKEFWFNSNAYTSHSSMDWSLFICLHTHPAICTLELILPTGFAPMTPVVKSKCIGREWILDFGIAFSQPTVEFSISWAQHVFGT